MKILKYLSNYALFPDMNRNFENFVNNERTIVMNIRNTLRDIAANLENQKKNQQ